jgi:hypothetical protein
MSFFEEMKKSISEELAGEEISQKAGEDQEPNQGDARKTKENIIDDTINIPELNAGNIEEYISNCPIDEKENHIIDDQIFNQYYRILPAKVVNQSGTYRSSGTGGKLKILGGDPEADREIHKKGGEALQATLKQRRTMAEDIMIMLAKKATPETVEALGLTADANNQEAIIAAALLQAIDGNMKAQQFIRDTIGEQPTIKQEVDIMTDDDRKLLANISDRLT